jgi:hypothetical protein
MELLYRYAFWYNSYEEIWYAVPTDKWTSFFSGKENREDDEGVLKSSGIDALIQLVCNQDTEVDKGSKLEGGFMGE